MRLLVIQPNPYQHVSRMCPLVTIRYRPSMYLLSTRNVPNKYPVHTPWVITVCTWLVQGNKRLHTKPVATDTRYISGTYAADIRFKLVSIKYAPYKYQFYTECVLSYIIYCYQIKYILDRFLVPVLVKCYQDTKVRIILQTTCTMISSQVDSILWLQLLNSSSAPAEPFPK